MARLLISLVQHGIMIGKKLVIGFAILISGHAQAIDLELEDANLQACVVAQAQKQAWQSVAQFTALECHSKNIRSLAGLEQLVNLEKLSLYNNQLAEVSLVNLPKLRHLNLAKNKIAQVALKNLPALRELYLFGNKLTALNLESLPALSLLKINDNQITGFTYKELPLLEKIYMFNNLMEDVDIYHLPAMKYMDARQNPMPDPLYEEMDKMTGVTFLHDGNAEDWQ